MKGVICKCINELIVKNFGQDKWEKILEKTGFPKDQVFLMDENVDDKKFMELVQNICDVLGITPQQVADAFGEYWVCEFAPRLFKVYYEGVNSAKEFILKMDEVHRQATANMLDARPPRFTYEWKDEKTLLMGYQSHRGLIDVMIGLLKGIRKYFKEDFKITKLSDKEVEIKFP